MSLSRAKGLKSPHTNTFNLVIILVTTNTVILLLLPTGYKRTYQR
jgi:hypothetical protein